MRFIKPFTLFTLILFLFSNCQEDNEFTKNTGVLRVHIKSSSEKDIEGARVALTLSQQDFVSRLFLTDTITNDKGIFDFGSVNVGNYFLYVNAAIDGKNYMVPKLIQVKPGQSNILEIYPEKTSGSLKISLMEHSHDQDIELKISNIKFAAVPRSEETSKIRNSKELLKYAYAKAETNENGQIDFGILPAGYYYILTFNDNGDAEMLERDVHVVEKKITVEKIYAYKNYILLIGKTWKVLDAKDGDGNLVDIGFINFTFNYNSKVSVNLTDGSTQEGTFTIYNNILNLSIPSKSINGELSLASNSEVSIRYYDSSISKIVTLRLGL